MTDFKNHFGLSDEVMTTKKLVSQGLQEAQKQLLLQSKGSEQSLYRVMNLLGCLTSKPYIDEALFENSANEIDEILAAIQAFEAPEFSPSNQDGALLLNGFKAQKNALGVLKNMSKFALAESFLGSLKPYCDKYDAFVRKPNNRVETTKVSGFQMVERRLSMMWYQLGFGFFDDLPQKDRPDEYYEEVFSRIGQLGSNGLSYKSLVTANPQQVIDLTTDIAKSSKRREIARIVFELETLPAIAPTRLLVNFHTSLSTVLSLMDDLERRVSVQLNRFYDRSDQKVDVAEDMETVAQLEKVLDDLQDKFSAFYLGSVRLLDNSMAKDSIRAIDGSRNQSDQWLRSRYAGFLSKFADLIKEQVGTNLLSSQELRQCMGNAMPATN